MATRTGAVLSGGQERGADAPSGAVGVDADLLDMRDRVNHLHADEPDRPVP